MSARYVWIIAFVFLGGCGGGINILPEPFTRERADGKIPVKVELIRKQVRAELDGMPEGEAEVLRWQAIEKDYNECRLSSARATKSEAEEVFAVCMSRRDYVYMLPIDAEQFHNDIFFELRKEKEESERLAEERRIAAEKKREEERIAREKKREEERIAREKKAVEERIAAAKKAMQDNKDLQLRLWAGDGDISEVKAWLADGANPNAANNIGGTALMMAAQNGYAEVAKILLDNRANPNAATNKRSTALTFAAEEGHSEVVKILLDGGADPNAATDDGFTALYFAAFGGHSESAKTLLSSGANPNAVRDNGWTALMEAAKHGHTKIVKILLSAGAYPNVENNDDQTALMWAVHKRNAEVAKVLLDGGANPNAVNDNGVTALMLVAEIGHTEIAKMLLSAGADPNAAADDGFTALMWAAQKGHAEIAKMLLDGGANPNAANKGTFTALMTAVEFGHPEVVKVLIAGGAEINQRTARGKLAADNHRQAVAALMNGNTPEELAAAGYSRTTIEKAKAEVNQRTAEMLPPRPPAKKPKKYSNSIIGAAFARGAYDAYNEIRAEIRAENQRRAVINLMNGIMPERLAAAGYSPIVIEQAKAEVVRLRAASKGFSSDDDANNDSFVEITALDIAKQKGFSEIVRILQAAQGGIPATAASPQTANPAESVFAKVWQSIVVVKSGERQGSGVIVRPNVVATNCHIFDGGEIAVYKHNNRRASTDTIYAASVMKRDDYRDFCLLRVRNLNGAAAQIRRYDNLGIGENVYAVGSPRGLDLSLSAGLISQLRQSADRRWIQTDAAISPGSSGGGLFDSSGNLIGITTEKITDENVEGIAFAIPADLAEGY